MQAGERLDGKYELLAIIGRGGMGEVFRAKHSETGREVAIKVVPRSALGDLLMARLQREAEAAWHIESEFIPRVLDVGRTAEGEFYMVMELLEGESLSERMKRDGPMPWAEVFRIGDNVLCALHDAHRAGVVHRDLKPGNVFLERLEDGGLQARILDFGVCKFDTTDAEKLTVTGESVGTIAYMAPEQIRGASRVDGRADLYSFAMVVFEMIAGRLPFDAQGQMALLASKLERTPKRLSEVVIGPLPEGLEDLLSIALSRDPDLRPHDAMEMLRLWRGLVASDMEATLKLPPLVSNPPTETAMTQSAPRLRLRMVPRRVVGAAAGAAVLVATSIFFLWPKKGPVLPSDFDSPQVSVAASNSAATESEPEHVSVSHPSEGADTVDAGHEHAALAAEDGPASPDIAMVAQTSVRSTARPVAPQAPVAAPVRHPIDARPVKAKPKVGTAVAPIMEKPRY